MSLHIRASCCLFTNSCVNLKYLRQQLMLSPDVYCKLRKQMLLLQNSLLLCNRNKITCVNEKGMAKRKGIKVVKGQQSTTAVSIRCQYLVQFSSRPALNESLLRQTDFIPLSFFFKMLLVQIISNMKIGLKSDGKEPCLFLATNSLPILCLIEWMCRMQGTKISYHPKFVRVFRERYLFQNEGHRFCNIFLL